MRIRLRPGDGQNSRHCRQVVSVLLLFMLIPIVPLSGSAQSAPPRQLTLIHPDDHEFDAILNQNYPGLADLREFPAFRPFLVLLRNDTSHSVRAYAVEWVIESSDRMRSTLMDQFLQRNNGTLAQRHAFAPSEIRLVSSLFDLSPSEYAKRRESIGKLLATLSSQPPYSFTNILSISAAVDGVMFDDGAYFGADHFQLFARYQCLRDAEHDEAASVLKLVQAKAPIGDVIGLLEHDIEAGRAANTGRRSPASICAYYHVAEAQALLGLYRSFGQEALVTRAIDLAQLPREKIWRSSQ